MTHKRPDEAGGSGQPSPYRYSTKAILYCQGLVSSGANQIFSDAGLEKHHWIGAWRAAEVMRKVVEITKFCEAKMCPNEAVVNNSQETKPCRSHELVQM